MGDETAPPPVNPIEAARQLRSVAEQHLTRARGLRYGTNPNSSTNLMNAKDRDRRVVDLVRECDMLYATINDLVQKRRSTGLKDLLSSLRAKQATISMYHRDASLYYQQAVAGESSGSVEVQRLFREAQQIWNLAQQFPTDPQMPNGKPENVLRGIVALLRATRYPGAETINWEEVVGSAKKEQLQQTQPEPGSLAAAFANLGASGTGTDGSGHDDEEYDDSDNDD